ncbi:hypothetical protein HYH02_002844 [Chlamydomonas schloesseri]|uniref:2Fe-2S ferredoxin-type domain-containing protein n=1 Tax=Chlamydomonas schloesseri TaxID=2026947 RepID=A0A835WRL0_9CHLO|nr:hypothetical protein HYH02_002844 [Chlamydomonas schloesseri]|eukprot:KAG2452607.1 hypothetical protein HYH02_002844 [Chlamydomonas schloesseri]
MMKSVQSRDGANVYALADHSGIHLPASCKQGACSACVCKVVDGHVKHTSDPACLTPKLKAEGYVAVCIANVSGDVTLQTHVGAKVRQARAEEADRMRHQHG